MTPELAAVFWDLLLLAAWLLPVLFVTMVVGEQFSNSPKVRYIWGIIILFTFAVIVLTNLAHTESRSLEVSTRETATVNGKLGEGTLDVNDTKAKNIDFAVSHRQSEAALIDNSSIEWRYWSVVLWICGVFCMALKSVIQLFRSARIRKKADVITGPVARRFENLCERMRVRHVDFLSTAQLSVPALLGWWRPAVVIPLACLSAIPANQIDALILHELAHFRRQDWIMEAMLQICLICFFWHPFMWIVVKKIRHHRECCCDNLALQNGADPESLSRGLLALAESFSLSRPSLAANGGNLKNRIACILGEYPSSSFRLRTFCVPILLCGMFGLLAMESDVPHHENDLVKDLESQEIANIQPLTLQQRIEMRNDGRFIRTKVQLMKIDKDWFLRAGMVSNEPIILNAQDLDRLFVAQDTKHVESTRDLELTTYQNQLALASYGRKERSYISHYKNNKLESVLDPQVDSLELGQVFKIRAFAMPGQDKIRITDVSFNIAELEEMRQHAFIDKEGMELAMELPVIKAAATPFLGPGIELQHGEALLLPMHIHQVRAEVYGKIDGVPLVYSAKRKIEMAKESVLEYCLIIPETFAQNGIISRSRIITNLTNPYLLYLPISLDLKDVTLSELVDEINKKVRGRLQPFNSDDFRNVRISVKASDESLSSVLNRVLKQTLYDLHYDEKGLYFRDDGMGGFRNFEAPPLSGLDKPLVESGDRNFSTDKLIKKLYDISDLISYVKKEQDYDYEWTVSMGENQLIGRENVIKIITTFAGISGFHQKEYEVSVDGNRLLLIADNPIHKKVETYLTTIQSNINEKMVFSVKVLSDLDADVIQWDEIEPETILDDVPMDDLACIAEAQCDVIDGDYFTVNLHEVNTSFNFSQVLSHNKDYFTCTWLKTESPNERNGLASASQLQTTTTRKNVKGERIILPLKSAKKLLVIELQ